MVAVLPSINMNINQLLDYLDSEKLQNAVKNMRWQKVWLKLPRFKIESGFSLGQPVRDLGIKQMFSGGFANISDDNLWVSDIIQKTFVEVNEEGTDRPFLYLIREKRIGVILFFGRMDEPCE